ncbi:MAG: DUF3482 domain-containing protein [Planctomycetota bacterium]
MTLPQIAVVGFVNAGKSSLVAALSEHGDIAIDEQGGTTRQCHAYTCPRSGEPSLVLIDTPGFQDARHANAWMQQWQDANAGATGPDSVRAFLEAFADSGRFVNEARVLETVLTCAAGLLYVAHADRRYRTSHDAEMALLARTGQPRMGVLNRVGKARHAEKWRDAMRSHFGKVVEIDAVHATFAQRMDLFASFTGLDDAWAPSIRRAVALLRGDRRAIHQRVADALGDLLVEVLSLRVEVPFAADEPAARERAEERARATARQRIAAATTAARRSVQDALGHERVSYAEEDRAVVAGELELDEVWRRFGMSRLQLVRNGVVAGSLTGGAIDAAVGQISFGTGMVIGAITGGFAGFAATRDFAISAPGLPGLFGRPRRVVVLPPTSDDWPVVVLEQGLIHFEAFAGISQAAREQGLGATRIPGGGFFVHFAADLRKAFLSATARIARRGRKGQAIDDDLRESLIRPIRAMVDTIDPLGD